MKYIEDILKIAIINNDIDFHESNIHNYDINHRFADEDNCTLLLYALSDSENTIYPFLLENGADISLVDDEGNGVLHHIVRSGSPDILSNVIIMGTNILKSLNSQNNDGQFNYSRKTE